MAAMSWLRDTENLEATVGAFFLVDVAAAVEEESPGSSLENRAEMNWVEVWWKGKNNANHPPMVISYYDNGVWVWDYKPAPTNQLSSAAMYMYMYVPLSGFSVANPVGQA